MAHAIQLSLFEANDDVSIIYRELAKTSEAQDNLRKSLFARHGDLMKMYAMQQEEIMQLKRFVIQHCGATLVDLSPAMPVFPAKKRRKKKESKDQLTFPGLA